MQADTPRRPGGPSDPCRQTRQVGSRSADASRKFAQAGRAATAGARTWCRKRSVSYFFLAPERLAALKEIPARMAFCWTAAAVRQAAGHLTRRRARLRE